jgi:chemotaxis protein methyltransferase CheR
VNPRIDPGQPDTIRPLAPGESQAIRQLAYRTFGLDLKSGKEELVSARLRRLVCNGGFRTFDAYYRSILADTTGAGLAAMIDALATNHTSFFREPDHFEFLRQKVLPRLAGREMVDLWSAACSTGEEVWTLAMVLQEAHAARKIRITASDISQKALAFAERGMYPLERCQGVPAAWLSRYFVAEGRPPKSWQVSPELRGLAAFRRLNLVQSYSWGRHFPVIFCRNVMIYFDQPTQERVVQQLSACLEPGGYLFVGHAESLNRVSHSLEYVQPAVYRRPEGKEVKWNRSS